MINSFFKFTFFFAVAIFVQEVSGQDRNFTGRLPATQLNNASFYPRVNGGSLFVSSGSFVVFRTAEPLVPGTGGFIQIYRLDRVFGDIVLVSKVHGTNAPAPGHCYRPSISDDGNLVAFETAVDLLNGGDTNGLSDIYVRDLTFNTTKRVSIRDDGTEPNGSSNYPSISGGGSFVAFTSSASNLVPTGQDANGSKRDVFRAFVTAPHIPEIVSLNNDTPPAQSLLSHSYFTLGAGRAISDDGCKVVFVGSPCDWDDDPGDCAPGINCLCPQPDNDCAGCQTGDEVAQAYMRDLCLNPPRTFRVSRVFSNGSFAAGNRNSYTVAIDGRGDDIAFSTRAANLPGDTDFYEDIFQFRLLLGDPNEINGPNNNGLLRASRPLGGASSNGNSTAPSVSDGGAFVAFASAASNLVTGDTNARTDIFVTSVGDPYGGPDFKIVRYSMTMTSGTFGITLGEANGDSVNPDIGFFSAGGWAPGPAVVYESLATNLVAGDTNGLRDIF
ncbi:MAG: hypothetical protein HY717_17890 [Planctomycetes bacterium]|nr:hypothetical protein [Planctomycetota bacterium]